MITTASLVQFSAHLDQKLEAAGVSIDFRSQEREKPSTASKVAKGAAVAAGAVGAGALGASYLKGRSMRAGLVGPRQGLVGETLANLRTGGSHYMRSAKANAYIAGKRVRGAAGTVKGAPAAVKGAIEGNLNERARFRASMNPGRSTREEFSARVG